MIVPQDLQWEQEQACDGREGIHFHWRPVPGLLSAGSIISALLYHQLRAKERDSSVTPAFDHCYPLSAYIQLWRVGLLVFPEKVRAARLQEVLMCSVNVKCGPLNSDR